MFMFGKFRFEYNLANRKAQCPLRMECEKVKIGECHLYHPDCANGVNCKYLVSRSCTRNHPKEHFIQTQAAYMEILRKREAKGKFIEIYCFFLFDFSYVWINFSNYSYN